MIALPDERSVHVRRNGGSFITISDVHAQLTIDRAHARELAEAIEQGRPIRLASIHGGWMWEYSGGIVLGCVSVEQRHGPWRFSDEGCEQLATEIRVAIGDA